LGLWLCWWRRHNEVEEIKKKINLKVIRGRGGSTGVGKVKLKEDEEI